MILRQLFFWEGANWTDLGVDLRLSSRGALGIFRVLFGGHVRVHLALLVSVFRELFDGGVRFPLALRVVCPRAAFLLCVLSRRALVAVRFFRALVCLLVSFPRATCLAFSADLPPFS